MSSAFHECYATLLHRFQILEALTLTLDKRRGVKRTQTNPRIVARLVWPGRVPDPAHPLACIVVPGRTFKYGPKGPAEGLVGSKRVILAITRGVYYGPETAAVSAEHAESYLRTVLSFIGVSNPEVVIAEGVTTGEKNKVNAMSSALEAVRQLTG